MKDPYLYTAIKACFEAAKEVMSIYRGEDFGISMKSDNSPLTRADKVAHQIIKNALEQTEIPILSEEGKHMPYEERRNWKRLWIVDPIDGTKEFIKRTDEFTINIALVENQSPIIGVIYAPALDLIFWGSQLGSFKLSGVSNFADFESNLEEKQKLPLQHRKETFVIAASKSHLTEATKKFIDRKRDKFSKVEVISKGSSLKICMVAEGTVDCYPRFGTTMEWDTAAGHAICCSAGAQILDLNQNALIYNKIDLRNAEFLCNN